MSHDATKVVMGGTTSSAKHGLEQFNSDPATFLAGLAVRRTSSNLLSVTKSAGRWAGISLGKNLSDSKSTTVLAAGEGIPILLEAAPARGVATITSYANLVSGGDDTLKVGTTTFTFKASPSLSTEVGAVTSNNQTATNLASKINAHATSGTLFVAVALGAVVTITAKNNATLGSSIDLVYTDTGGSSVGLTVDAVTFTGGNITTDFVTLGKPVYISDTTGKGDDPESASTVSNAVYASGILSGIQEDGTLAACALVDMIGGL